MDSRRLALLLPLILLMIFAIPPPYVRGSTTITVCDSGCTEKKIQDAISMAVSGDTIEITSGYNSQRVGETFPVTLTAQDGITITGDPGNQVDISPGANPHDGFVFATYNDVVENLNIVDSSTSAKDISRVIAQGPHVLGSPFPDAGTAVHGTGLTISNLNIDMTGAAGDHAQYDLVLIGNNGVIQSNTLKGAYTWTISIDGATWSITGNTVSGLDHSGSIVTVIGLAYGNDLPNAPCTGFPTGYTITGNTFTDFAQDGINSCNSSAPLTISGNTVTDAAKNGITLSNTQGVTVSNNIVTWNLIPAFFGISLPGTSQSAKISGNTITGRASRDPGSKSQGLVLGNCVNCQVSSNTVQNMDSEGIYTTETAGTPTSSVFDSNTASNNNGDGIAYLGSDSSGTHVDGTVMKNNVANNNGGNGIIFLNAAGKGNAFTGNSADSNNGAGAVNTHAYNLQKLSGTLIDRNRATNTVTPGVGYFIANSASLMITNNFGSPCTGPRPDGLGGGAFILSGVSSYTSYNNSCNLPNNMVPTSAWVSATYLVALQVSGAMSSGPDGDQSTTSTSFTSTLEQITVTASGSQQYLLLATSQVWNTASGVGTSIAICRDGARASGDQFGLGATPSNRYLAAAVLLDTPSAGSHTYALCYKTDPTGTAFVSGTLLLLLPVSGGQSHGPGGDQSTTSTTFVDSTETISITQNTASQQYLFLASSQLWGNSATVGSSMAICRDGGKISGDNFQLGATLGNRQLPLAIAIDQPSVGSHTYSLCFKTDPGSTADVSATFLVEVPITPGSGLSSGPFGDQSTTSTTFTPSTSTIPLSTSGSQYLLIATSQLWNDLSTVGSSMAVCLDGSRISGDEYSIGAVANQRHLASAVALSTPSTGSHTFSLCTKTDPGFHASPLSNQSPTTVAYWMPFQEQALPRLVLVSASAQVFTHADIKSSSTRQD